MRTHIRTASLTDSHRGESQWSDPAEAGVRVSWRGRGGRELRGGVEQKSNRGKFKNLSSEQRKIKTRRKLQNTHRLLGALRWQLRVSGAGVICLWMERQATGGELRQSLLATAIWTTSNPSIKQQTQWKGRERVRVRGPSRKKRVFWQSWWWPALETNTAVSVSQENNFA